MLSLTYSRQAQKDANLDNGHGRHKFGVALQAFTRIKNGVCIMKKRWILLITDREPEKSYDTLVQTGEPFELARSDIASFDPLELAGKDIAILDCGFDIKNGLLLLAEIKNVRRAMPIIFVSDVSSEEQIVQIFRAGANDFFKKPINMTELRHALKRLLHNAEDGEPLDPLYRSAPIPVRRAICFIEKNFFKPVRLDELAGAACLSKHHFCRTFKESVGMSPMQFLNHARVRTACELLRSTSIPISMVGLQVGFQNMTGFGRCFKRVTGQTAGEYRRASRNALRLMQQPASARWPDDRPGKEALHYAARLRLAI